MCEDNGDPVIATLHNVILAPDFCKQSIFDQYVNKFGTYLFIPQRVLNCVLRSKREELGYINTKCKKET